MLDLQNLKTFGNKQAYMIAVVVFHKEGLSRVHTNSGTHFKKPFVNIYLVIFRVILNATYFYIFTCCIFFSFTDIAVIRQVSHSTLFFPHYLSFERAHAWNFVTPFNTVNLYVVIFIIFAYSGFPMDNISQTS